MDVILCVVGAFTIGLAVFDGLEEVWKFDKGKPIEVGTPSAAGGLMAPKPALTSTRTLNAGAGYTTAWGEIVISRLGSQADRRLAAIHESVHRFLTPRLTVLRTFRIKNRSSSYERSAFSKYLEEMLAEAIAQVSVNGFRAVFRGISFPVQKRYVSLLRIDGNVRPFLPEVGGLVAGGFSIGGMVFEIWETPQPPKEVPNRE